MDKSIDKYLIEKFNKIQKYFPSMEKKNTSEKWIKNYSKRNINHDEPWVTLIAAYALFGEQNDYSTERLAKINDVFNSALPKAQINFSSIEKVVVEEKLPEIITYRKYLKDKNSKIHLYPDRREIIKNKCIKTNASFEGNTNVDLIVEGVSNGRNIVCLIEAKFLSDISYQTLYNPYRNQIIRNIDSGIDCVRIEKEKYKKDEYKIDSFNDFYFFMLTPKVFKTENYYKDDKKIGLDEFGARTSRLYSYKMDEYTQWENIKKELPHRNLADNEWKEIMKGLQYKKLEDKDWKTISNNIGWLTFEDMYENAKFHDDNEEKKIRTFFKDRNLETK